MMIFGVILLFSVAHASMNPGLFVVSAGGEISKVNIASGAKTSMGKFSGEYIAEGQSFVNQARETLIFLGQTEKTEKVTLFEAYLANATIVNAFDVPLHYETEIGVGSYIASASADEVPRPKRAILSPPGTRASTSWAECKPFFLRRRSGFCSLETNLASSMTPGTSIRAHR
jgi:hypothetical protein